MRKLPEVQQAKELMNDAINWSVFTWMLEKSRVRETADQANAALDRLEPKSRISSVMLVTVYAEKASATRPPSSRLLESETLRSQNTTSSPLLAFGEAKFLSSV